MKRIRIAISGCVQGIGFRPFVYRLAHHYQLTGHIRNTNRGVSIDIQGDEASVDYFQKELISSKPERAIYSEILVEEAPLHEAGNFIIESSAVQSGTDLALLPDTAICQQCLRELSDPGNRRYRYPFLHCVNCGPRFSLFLRMPFDRENTTMLDFSMCEECRNEYNNPADRRFYSQTNCCPQCGPSLKLLDNGGRLLAEKHQSVMAALEYLRQGKIVCLKNTGGYLLLADASDDKAVSRLRSLKKRPRKPFAVLMPDTAAVKQIAQVSPAAEKVLASAGAPIVLLKKLPGLQHIAPSVAPDNPYYGIMLPHNALQHLLLGALGKPLVATSGNISGRPLCVTEEEAFSQLSAVADVFLVHNRRIANRLDDSIVHIIEDRPMLLRRARGYIPYAMKIPQASSPLTSVLLAAGGHQKNSFAFAKGNKIYVGQHIGNLETVHNCRAYDQEIEKWETLLSIQPEEGVGDNHPDFYTTDYLQRRNLNTDSIQHHQAHVWSGMLDNQLSPPLFSAAWDGTGLGDDQTIWGGEAFVVSERGMCRFASLFPFRLPGGEKAIREPRRSAFGLLYALTSGSFHHIHEIWLSREFDREELSVLTQALAKGINSPLCSSVGRLFDGVSALLGCCSVSQFEGQAALALEALADQAENTFERYKLVFFKENDIWIIDWRPMLNAIIEDKANGIPVAEISWAFHYALAQGIVDLAQKACEEKVLLTGGVMQNKLLAETAIALLRQAGFKPYWHHDIPPNDGGLAVGQAVGSLSGGGSGTGKGTKISLLSES